MKISGRTFVISGGASGLGRATALELARNGGNIAILDLDEEKGAELVQQLGGESRAKFFAVDVTDSATIAAAVQGTTAWVRATAAPLGGVVPAAGVGLPGLILDGRHRPLPLRAIDRVLAVNLRGTLDVVRQFLPGLARAAPCASPAGDDAERGVVVLVASAAAFDGQAGQAAMLSDKVRASLERSMEFPKRAGTGGVCRSGEGLRGECVPEWLRD